MDVDNQPPAHSPAVTLCNVRKQETMVAKIPNLPVSPGVFIFTPCCYEGEKNSCGCEAEDEFHQVVREMNSPSAGLFLAL